MSDCIFCKIVNGSLPAKKVYEDEKTLAFLDIFPANPGHTLVIPKIHVADIHEAEEETYVAVASTAKKIADLLSEKLSCDGVSVFQMNKDAGWQTVFHLHMHVVPRFIGDQLTKPWEFSSASEEALEDSLQRILS